MADRLPGGDRRRRGYHRGLGRRRRGGSCWRRGRRCCGRCGCRRRCRCCGWRRRRRCERRCRGRSWRRCRRRSWRRRRSGRLCRCRYRRRRGPSRGRRCGLCRRRRRWSRDCGGPGRRRRRWCGRWRDRRRRDHAAPPDRIAAGDGHCSGRRGQCATEKARAGPHRHARLSDDVPDEVYAVESRRAGDLPENVTRVGAVEQRDGREHVGSERAPHLEDVDPGTVESEISGRRQVGRGREAIDAWSNLDPIELRGQCATRPGTGQDRIQRTDRALSCDRRAVVGMRGKWWNDRGRGSVEAGDRSPRRDPDVAVDEASRSGGGCRRPPHDGKGLRRSKRLGQSRRRHEEKRRDAGESADPGSLRDAPQPDFKSKEHSALIVCWSRGIHHHSHCGEPARLP